MEKSLEILKLRFEEHRLLNDKEVISFKEISEIINSVDDLIGKKSVDNIETPEQFFKSVMNRITEIKTSDKYPDYKFYMIGDKVYLEQNTKTGNFYLIYNVFWEVFESKFNLNYQEIKELTKTLLEEHLKCNVITTRTHQTKTLSQLEEHLKCNVRTTEYVENSYL